MLHQSLGMQLSQSKLLKTRFAQPLQNLANACTTRWHCVASLEQALHAAFVDIPQAERLYLIDKTARQLSATISRYGHDPAQRGADLSHRPYADSLYPKRYLALVPAYVDEDQQARITALQPLWKQEQFLGFIALDWRCQDLPFVFGNALRPRPEAFAPVGHKKNPPALTAQAGL
jgi:hypothetical protein